MEAGTISQGNCLGGGGSWVVCLFSLLLAGAIKTPWGLGLQLPNPQPLPGSPKDQAGMGAL